MTVVVANDSRLIITKKDQYKMEKLTEIIQTLWKDEMISSHAYSELLNFTNTHQDLQLLQSRVIESVCIDDVYDYQNCQLPKGSCDLCKW